MYKKVIHLLFTLALVNSMYAQNKPSTALFNLPENPVVNDFQFYLDTRYNANTTFNSHQTMQSDFEVATTRIYLTTRLFDKVDFNLRYNLNQSGGGSPLEFAFFDFNINERWSIQAGQLITNWGSFEIDYNGANIYLYSIVSGNIQVYSPGVGVSYKFADQKINFQTVSIGSQFASEAYKNKAYGYMTMWEGSLFEDKLKTRYGYALMQHDSSKYYSWITLGNQLHAGNWLAELEWLYGYRNFDYSTSIVNFPTDTGSAYVKDNVLTASLKYYFPTWNPYVKAIYNKRDDLDKKGAYTELGISTAIEYYPFAGQNMLSDIRLFAAYNYTRTNFSKSFADIENQNTHQVLAGVRWLIPIAKQY